LTTTIRFLVTVVAGLVALAFAGTAFAAYNPSLLVAGTNHVTGGSGPLVIGVGQDASDDATAAATVYSPPGYGVTLGQPAGTQLGTLSANVKVAALNNARFDVTGTVKTDNPANYLTNPCSPGAHEAVWILEFNLLGATVRLPMYVDRVTAGPEAAFASAKMMVCFSSPYVPPPQGAPSGASVLIAAFSVRGVFTNPRPRGSYAWNGVFVPYTPGTATPNPANTAQSTSYVRLPVTLSVKAKRQKRGKRTFARVTSCLTEAGQPIRGVTVSILGGRTVARAKRVARGLTNARGCMTTRVRVKTKTMFLYAFVDLQPRSAATCTPATGLAPRCSRPSVAPAFDLTSRTAVRVRR
jgi:hypothetical protein